MQKSSSYVDKLVTNWVTEQTNCPLQSNKEVELAKEYLSGNGAPLHNDKWKNWDNMLATVHAVKSCDQDDDILDAGGTRDPGSPSVFLPGLAKLGYRGLISCNLDEAEVPVYLDGVLYCKQNIERTSFRKNQFKFIACLSVIEHGVDWKKYFVEMHRILELGGKLFTSFDYWPSPIDTGDRQAFGAPVRIFTQNDVREMAFFAAQTGLGLPRGMPQLKFNVPTPTVNWMGLDYTFFNLLLQKSS